MAWLTVLVFIVIAYGALIATSIGMEKLKKQRATKQAN